MIELAWFAVGVLFIWALGTINNDNDDDDTPFLGV